MKEVWVDCTERDLEDVAIECNATGIKGKSKKRLNTLPENSVEIEIKSYEDLKKIDDYAKYNVPCIIFSCPDWKVIPVENIVQKMQGTKIKYIVRANTLDEATAYADALDAGVSGVLVSDSKLVKDFCSYYRSIKLELVEAKITKIRAARKAARVCLDLTDIQISDEALAVGNRVGFMYLVGFETLENPHVDKRDFRCNAGAVSMRVLKDVGSTPYLRDMEGGDEVLVINSRGEGRICDIGRTLTEKRPLLYIEAKYKDETGKIYLQNAETGSLISPNGRIRLDELSMGDNILAYVPKIMAGEGRHLGEKTTEFFLEK